MTPDDLVTWRIAQGLTQTAAADVVFGVSRYIYNRMENGCHNATMLPNGHFKVWVSRCMRDYALYGTREYQF